MSDTFRHLCSYCMCNSCWWCLFFVCAQPEFVDDVDDEDYSPAPKKKKQKDKTAASTPKVYKWQPKAIVY